MQFLAQEQQLPRLRISSIEPRQVTSSLIDFIKENSWVCNHLHIPLQSGSDFVLKQMNRKYKTSFFNKILNEARKKIPHICLGSDVMVGFPGESDLEFEKTFEFIKQSPLNYLHVFPYSERPDTPSQKLPDQVTKSVKQERTRILRDYSEKKLKEFYRKWEGRNEKIVVEKVYDGKIYGHTDNYIPVEAPNHKPVDKGDLIKVLIKAENSTGTIQAQTI